MAVDRCEESPKAPVAPLCARCGIRWRGQALQSVEIIVLQGIETTTTHNARHRRARDSKGLSPSVPEVVAEDREFL